MDEKLSAVQSADSIVGMTQAINDSVGMGLGVGLVLVTFTVSFLRLSPGGYLAAFTASSFTSTILAFILASASLIPGELPFIIGAASVAGLAYMYQTQR